MQVFVRGYGQTFTLHTRESHTLKDFKRMVQEKTSIAPNMQMLLFNNQMPHGMLDDSSRLEAWGIKDMSTVYLSVRLLGMISTFEAPRTRSPATDFLMLADQERRYSTISMTYMAELAEAEGADKDARFELHNKCSLLKPHYAVMRDFLDALWRVESRKLQLANQGVLFDLKAVIKPHQMVMLLDEATLLTKDPSKNGDWATHQLLCMYKGKHKTHAKLAFRITRASASNKTCINFHCDGPYAESTTQISLNSCKDYNGGRLVFFAQGSLWIVDRKEGTVTHHTPNVLHGVTCLHSGTRMSLFVLDEANGLGDSNVVQVQDCVVKAFLRTRRLLKVCEAGEAGEAGEVCKGGEAEKVEADAPRHSALKSQQDEPK